MDLKTKISELDPSQMLEKIQEFPQHLREGLERGEEIETVLDQSFKNMVFCGMGGSAIAGDFIRVLLQSDLKIPFLVNRQYTVPKFVNPKTVVFISSYSGNTEESLSALHDAESKGALILCLTSGGQLGQIAEERGYPLYLLPKGFPPRAALGYNLGILLGIFHRAKTAHITIDEIEIFCKETQIYLESWRDPNQSDNISLQMAQQIQGRIPIIYGSVETTEPVTLRWKGQLNENSKMHAFCHVIPEMNHNEIMGWERYSENEKWLKSFIPVLLQSSFDSERIQKREDILKKLLHENEVNFIEVEAKGDSVLSQMIYLTALGDMVSFWLALLNNVDPTAITSIQKLKRMLESN